MSKERFEVIEEIAVLRTADTGWTRELSTVRWYEKENTIDIRWWSPNKDRAGKGVSLTKDEALLLFDGLKKLLNLESATCKA